MRKAWIYKRKSLKGWWVGWYESGKRTAKALPTKALAEHYRQIKYTQLNSDVFTGTVTVDWQQMREEYVLVQRELDKSTSLLRDCLAFGKEVGAGPRLPQEGLIIIKPNLTNSSPPPVTTSVAAAEAVYNYCKAHTKAEIVIGEGCGTGKKKIWILTPDYTNHIHSIIFIQ